MAGLKVTALPESPMVSYLAYELGVLNDLQVNGKDIILSWDQCGN